jgi:hypothetical protein
MNTYVLFIFGMFDDHEDIEYFCSHVISESKTIESIRFMIENSENIIVSFDSIQEPSKISEDLFPILIDEHIKFYFIFDIKNLITAHLPQQIKDLLYKQFDDNTIVRIDHERIKKTIRLDLDDLLEKIKDYGVESLTEDEKNFLDNFKN